MRPAQKPKPEPEPKKKESIGRIEMPFIKGNYVSPWLMRSQHENLSNPAPLSFNTPVSVKKTNNNNSRVFFAPAPVRKTSRKTRKVRKSRKGRKAGTRRR